MRKQAEGHEEALGELQYAQAASDMEHIQEVKELKGEIRGLKHELALLKGFS